MSRFIRLASAELAVCVLLLIGANAQRRGSSGSKTTASAPGVVSGTTTPSTTNPQQTIYYAGKVMLDSGIAPPSVAVLRVCNGFRHRETYTSADGSFSFMVGDRTSDALPDASEDTREFSGTYAGQPATGNPMTLGQSNFASPIADCELRADLAGYTSSSIHLDQSMSNSNVGVIVLHSRGKKADGMVTVGSLEVPAKARKEYEKGSELLEKGNLADAEKSLRKAIEEYPKFAEAWQRLGDLEQRRKNSDAAMKDYAEAISADPNLPLPYLRLAFLTAVAKEWEQTRQLTDRLISLDPASFPMAYYYNAVAELNLKHLDKAESNGLRAEAMDKQHTEPRVELLLASVYIAKDKYASAADHYRTYVKLVPDGPMTERVKTDLARTEEMAKSQVPASTPADK
jgi:cytochrome c-type biogenesis protein CcmH/NrfG